MRLNLHPFGKDGAPWFLVPAKLCALILFGFLFLYFLLFFKPMFTFTKAQGMGIMESLASSCFLKGNTQGC
jgi:hypothetical protein